ncbi:NUDIX domain-containing protein [Nocardioides sp.]|uniref:NUDIX domain-containing protein n=1 Tax=Nocardioides sp. TaxID=35761 RepID=UPI0039E26B1F
MSEPAQDVEESWPVLGSRDIHRDSWVVAMRQDTITRPEGGEPFDRLVVEHPGAAIVLAIDDEHRVLVQRQYRHAVGMRLYQLPAGVLDEPGESPLEVAQRELREEAEYAAASWTPLLDYFVSPGFTNQRFHLFLARDLSRVGRGDFEPHHEELDLVAEWIRFTDLLDDVTSGRVRDGGLVTAVLAYNVKSRRGEL